MRDVAIISFAQGKNERSIDDRNEVEMLMPVTAEALGAVDMTIRDIGFTCSGSTDYLAGAAFSFVMTLDGVGPWPPIQESHVEMDGAWAVYEAWVKLQLGEIDSALVYCYGKSSPGDLPMVMTRQLDPYSVGPLWPDSVSLAALQARALLDSGKVTVEQMAEVAARSRKAALDNPYAQVAVDRSVEELLAGAGDDRPAAQARLPADHRRRRRSGARRRRRGQGALRAAGLDQRHRPPHRADGARRARPHRLAVDPHGGGEGGRRARARCRWPRSTRRSPTRS